MKRLLCALTALCLLSLLLAAGVPALAEASAAKAGGLTESQPLAGERFFPDGANAQSATFTLRYTLPQFAGDQPAAKSVNASFQAMYEEACYNYAEELYAAGKVYEALPYYRRIPDYRDVTTKKLQRRAYLILGSWASADGQFTAEFRDDGTCTLFGDELYFAVDGYGLKTGQTPDALTLTHKLTTLTDTALSIRILADGRNEVHQLARASQQPITSTSPAPTITPAPQGGDQASME